MAEPLTRDAFAKVNLSLQVQARDASGFHPLRSLAQSVDWSDSLQLEEAEDDDLVVSGVPLDAGDDNLAWRAATSRSSLRPMLIKWVSFSAKGKV